VAIFFPWHRDQYQAAIRMETSNLLLSCCVMADLGVKLRALYVLRNKQKTSASEMKALHDRISADIAGNVALVCVLT
jgi:hypothetical protein